MSEPWALCMDSSKAAALGTIRNVPCVVACLQGNDVWAQGPDASDELNLQLRSLPSARRFRLLADRQLVPVGALVPRGQLPEGDWQPLAEWLGVQFPTAGFAGARPPRAALGMVRCSLPADANLLLTSLRRWTEYAIGAPQIRLDCWSFAACADERVLIRGTPLPALPGTYFTECQGVAIQAGWATDPAIDPEVLRALLKLEADDCALLFADGSWQRVAGEYFVKTTRSAVRGTLEAANG